MNRSHFARQPRLRNRPAFSMIEMVIVLVVSGIVLSIGLPRIDSTRYRADAVAQLVRTTLQQGQRNALLKQHDVLVSFDTVTNRMRIAWDKNNDGDIDTDEVLFWKGLEANNQFVVPSTGVNGTVTKSVTGAGVRSLDNMPTITFHRDGSVSSDTEVYMSSAGKGTARIYRAVVLTQATGRSDWYRLASDNTWRLAAL